jgi:glutaredoxin
MNKKITTLFVGLAIVYLLSSVVLGSREKKSSGGGDFETDIKENVAEEPENAEIFYWGTTCPHCHDTIDWMDENGVDEKLTVIRKEIYGNRSNSLELVQKAKECGIDERGIFVPFLYTSEGKCLIGTPEIVGYLEEKMGQLSVDFENEKQFQDEI